MVLQRQHAYKADLL